MVDAGEAVERALDAADVNDPGLYTRGAPLRAALRLPARAPPPRPQQLAGWPAVGRWLASCGWLVGWLYVGGWMTVGG